ncbi:MAG: TlpA disulfide reductase family protein [Natronomonas sp.]
MQRRELLAGLGSVATLGAAGAIAIRGFPSIESGSADREGAAGSDRADEEETNEAEPVKQVAVETIDAPGSDAGEVQVPATDRPTFIDFFGTWCPPCIDQMPALAEANERIGDEVLFISVTTEAVGRSVTEAEVVEWWDTHGGNWLLGIDPTAELAAQYNPPGYPAAFAIDATGTVQWSDSGVKTADELVAGIEQAFDDE